MKLKKGRKGAAATFYSAGLTFSRRGSTFRLLDSISLSELEKVKKR